MSSIALLVTSIVKHLVFFIINSAKSSSSNILASLAYWKVELSPLNLPILSFLISISSKGFIVRPIIFFLGISYNSSGTGTSGTKGIFIA